MLTVELTKLNHKVIAEELEQSLYKCNGAGVTNHGFKAEVEQINKNQLIFKVTLQEIKPLKLVS